MEEKIKSVTLFFMFFALNTPTNICMPMTQALVRSYDLAPTPPPSSPLLYLYMYLIGKGVGEEPNHITALKPVSIPVWECFNKCKKLYNTHRRE